MKRYADLPEADRMTEAHVRQWEVLTRKSGGCGGEDWIQETLQRMAEARCEAAVPWFGEIDGHVYYRRCQRPILKTQAYCRIHAPLEGDTA